jgi:hypothetical protein
LTSATSPKITLTSAQRDAVCDMGLDCLGRSDAAAAACYLDREFSDDLRQMLADLEGTGSGAVELAIIRPQSVRRILIRQARDHVFAAVPGTT